MVRVIAGAYGGASGAAGTFSPINLWDLRLNARRSLSLDMPDGHTAALFVLKGVDPHRRADGRRRGARGDGA